MIQTAPVPRALEYVHLALNFLELIFGGWLCCCYSVKNLGSLDRTTTFRGFCGLFVGGWLFAHGGFSVFVFCHIVPVRFSADEVKCITAKAAASDQRVSEWIRAAITTAMAAQ